MTSMSRQCRCEQFLDSSNVQCNVSLTPFKFLRSGNSWFSYNNNTQCITGTTSCPFDYCNRSNVSFDIMAPDHQCVGNRAGILCGQCQSQLSIMLGSKRCDACSNWYIFLLPVFALAGIVLVAVLMFLKLSVSVGTINGLLFYANMVKLNEVFFFPNGSVPVVSQFISWLNLDLGIDLFDGLDGYWNTWLQLPFLLTCSLGYCPSTSYTCLMSYTKILLTVCLSCLPVPAHGWYYCGMPLLCVALQAVWLSCNVPLALATLCLMSYTKILLTVTNALVHEHVSAAMQCTQCGVRRWVNIEYGSGKHLILVVFSCGVLVVGHLDLIQ